MKHRPRPEEQDDLPRPRLVDMLDPRHELVKLAGLIDWQVFEREWAGFFPSHRGRPATEPRLVAGLLYLQHAYRLSDEAVVARWVENPYYQHFTGETFFQNRLPIDASSLTLWRKRIGEEGVEWMLTQTIQAGQKSGVIDEGSAKRVAVDTTVMEKNIAIPRMFPEKKDKNRMSGMQHDVIYFSTWPSGSGLASGSVRPTLDALADFECVSSIVYVCIESSKVERPDWLHQTISFEPIIATNGSSLLARTSRFLKVLLKLRRILKSKKNSILLSRGAPAAGIASLASINTHCSLMVESFEPHANYMIAARIWLRHGAKSIVSKILERLTLKRADWIAVVSDKYHEELSRKTGVKATLSCIPCVADQNRFSFDAMSREKLRHDMALDEKFVVTYVGKFGGLYLEREAFEFFATLARRDDKVFFLIITPNDQDQISRLAERTGLVRERYLAFSSAHANIAGYLSASDVGLGLHRSTESSYAFSPIKYAEYWACGLPIIAPVGVGSEGEAIEINRLGILVNYDLEGDIDRVLSYINGLQKHPILRQDVRASGGKLRNPLHMENELRKAFSMLFRRDEGTDLD